MNVLCRKSWNIWIINLKGKGIVGIRGTKLLVSVNICSVEGNSPGIFVISEYHLEFSII